MKVLVLGEELDTEAVAQAADKEGADAVFVSMAAFPARAAELATSGFDAVLGGNDHGGKTCIAGSVLMDSCRVIVPLCAENFASGACTVSPNAAAALNAYFAYGGTSNLRTAFRYVKRLVSGETVSDLPVPAPVPMDSIFTEDGKLYPDLESYFAGEGRTFDTYAGLIGYRSRWISGDISVELAVKEALQKRGIGVIMAFANGAEEEETGALGFDEAVRRFFCRDGRPAVDILINFMFYAKRAEAGLDMFESTAAFFRSLDIPVVRPAGLSRKTKAQWQESSHPYQTELLSNFIAPEMQGVIENVHTFTGGAKKTRIPDMERIDAFAQRAASWVSLRKTPNAEKHVVIMLHNAPCAGVEATVGLASDLDAFESAVAIMRRMKEEGYTVKGIPESGKALKDLIMSRKAISDFRWTSAEDIEHCGGALYIMPPAEYEKYFETLPERSRTKMTETWGKAPGEAMVTESGILVTGVDFGNVAVMVQPKRGCYGAKCTGEVCKILQDPDCPPTHQFLASYEYIRSIFRADCVVHLGTHGSLEYLPGKSSGLSPECFSDIAIKGLINLYPYNAAAVSQALIARRRSYACLISYLPSPGKGLTKDAQELLADLKEYFSAKEQASNQEADIRQRIIERAKTDAAVRTALEKEADFDAAANYMLSRLLGISRGKRSGYMRCFGEAPSKAWEDDYISELYEAEGRPDDPEDEERIRQGLRSAVSEMESLIRAMSGRYVMPGPGGDSCIRGRQILPTGRNIHGGAQDTVPTKTAYERGSAAADALIGKYRREEGRLPEKVALNMTSLDITRSGGEQMSQYMSLMGVRPVWLPSGKVERLELVPLAELGRPRIDVAAHISSVLRDSWPVAIGLLDRAAAMAASADEPEGMNFVKANSRKFKEAGAMADGRIFGGKPGTYTSAVGLALKASAWNSEEDLARYFIDASSYVYGEGKEGVHSPETFAENIKQLDLSCDITNSRKTDGGASSYSARVQGGFAMAAKALGSKKSIRQYMGESKTGKNVQIKSLKDHVTEAVKDTLLNEFWLEEEKKEGYMGASDLMQRMQNLFDTQCVGVGLEDSLVDDVVKTCILDPSMQQWFSENNRFALEESQRRFLELETRGRWKADPKVLESLKRAYLQAEGDLEDGLSGLGEIQAGNVDIITDSGISTWAERLKSTDAVLKKGGR